MGVAVERVSKIVVVRAMDHILIDCIVWIVWFRRGMMDLYGKNWSVQDNIVNIERLFSLSQANVGAGVKRFGERTGL